MDIQLGLAILAGCAVMALLVFVIRLLQRRNRVLRQLGFPLYVGALVAGLEVATLFRVEALAGVEQGLGWLLVFFVVVAAIRLAGLYYFDVYLFSSRGVRLPPLLPPVFVIAAYLLAALIILRQAFPELDVTPILATSAITSLVLGLALQPILGNFFSGLVISLERPFRINDWVKVGDVEARVVDITWRTTHLRTRDNDNVILPNAEIANQEILNYYYPHPLHLERIHVGVHYRTPPYRVKSALLAATRQVKAVLEKPSPEVYVNEFGDSAIDYELRVWIEDIAQRPRIASDIRAEIWEEFRRRGITIPFPIRTLEIEPRAGTLGIKRAVESRGEGAAEGRLYVARGPDRGAATALGEEPVTIGRSSACDLTLGGGRISKEHCRVEWRGDGYFVVDLGSQFGTIVNERKVEEQRLADLDRIEVGEDVLRFESRAG